MGPWTGSTDPPTKIPAGEGIYPCFALPCQQVCYAIHRLQSTAYGLDPRGYTQNGKREMQTHAPCTAQDHHYFHLNKKNAVLEVTIACIGHNNHIHLRRQWKKGRGEGEGVKGEG